MIRNHEIRLRRLEAAEPLATTVIVASTHEEAEERLQGPRAAGVPLSASPTLIITGVPRSRSLEPMGRMQ